MTSSNAWAEFASIFARTKTAHSQHEQAKAELKKLMPVDAHQAIGHGVRGKRSKSGTISFDLLKGEDSDAASECIASLAAALAKAQIELVNPEKSLIGTISSDDPERAERAFRYASLSSGLDIVRKVLGQHEIATVQTTSVDQTGGFINLTTVLAHASGEWIASDWPVCAVSETATPHRMGAKLTYSGRLPSKIPPLTGKLTGNFALQKEQKPLATAAIAVDSLRGQRCFRSRCVFHNVKQHDKVTRHDLAKGVLQLCGRPHASPLQEHPPRFGYGAESPRQR